MKGANSCAGVAEGVWIRGGVNGEVTEDEEEEDVAELVVRSGLPFVLRGERGKSEWPRERRVRSGVECDGMSI